MRNTTHALLLLCPLAIASVCVLGNITKTEAAPPNVLLLMGDDHGWEETGYNGHPHVKTPVLDEMAAQGLRFDRFYAGHCNCSPTRASFLTGRHPNRMGTFSPGWSFRPEEITIAKLLGDAGYRCGHFGKWHVGPVKAESPTSPGAMGFHTWVSHDNFFELNPVLSRNGATPEKIIGESSDVIVSEALRFIDNAKAQGKPFLGVIWFGSPHEPYSGLPEDLKLYDDLPAKYPKRVSVTSNDTGDQVTRPQGAVLRERYAEITAMDRAIGKLRSHLARQGIKDNTLLFYCGDNGTSADASLGGPHRGVKSTLYEGGILVPGLVEWPARIPKPVTSSFRASTSDLLPTLCSIAGVVPPNRPLDGVDLTPVIDGTATSRTQPLAFWEYPTGRANRDRSTPWIEPRLQEGTTPLVKLMNGKPTRDFLNLRIDNVTPDDRLGPRAIVIGDWKYVVHGQKADGLKRELFDLRTDPAEKANLAAQHPGRVAEMEAQLSSWQDSVVASLLGKDYATK